MPNLLPSWWLPDVMATLCHNGKGLRLLLFYGYVCSSYLLSHFVHYWLVSAFCLNWESTQRWNKQQKFKKKIYLFYSFRTFAIYSCCLLEFGEIHSHFDVVWDWASSILLCWTKCPCLVSWNPPPLSFSAVGWDMMGGNPVRVSSLAFGQGPLQLQQCFKKKGGTRVRPRQLQLICNS